MADALGPFSFSRLQIAVPRVRRLVQLWSIASSFLDQRWIHGHAIGMAATSRCMLCGVSLPPKNRSEHVLLDAIGGRLESRPLTCSVHNSRPGSAPHRHLLLR